MTSSHGLVIAAATDGACSGNPGPGGWAALIRFSDGNVKEIGGHEASTTNNRMELKAALEILQKLKNLPLHPNLTIKTDSKYLINGFSDWISKWKQKGWKTSAGKAVLNQDLWEELDNARIKNLNLEYVKGHSGDIDNDRVDEIAVAFSKGVSIELKGEKAYFQQKGLIIKPLEESKKDNKIPPYKLKELFSRLEIANNFAERGYALTLIELSELTGEPIKKLEKKMDSWQWRNWIVEPMGNAMWRLRALKKNEHKSTKD